MIRAFLTALVGIVLLVPFAQAEKKSIDELTCGGGTLKLLTAGKEATVLAIEAKRINVKNGETQSCIGVISIIAGKQKANGYCMVLGPEEGFRLLEFTGSEKRGEGTWKFLYGTEKWKGITGGGKYKIVNRGKPIAKGTFQSCNQVTGTYELP